MSNRKLATFEVDLQSLDAWAVGSFIKIVQQEGLKLGLEYQTARCDVSVELETFVDDERELQELKQKLNDAFDEIFLPCGVRTEG